MKVFFLLVAALFSLQIVASDGYIVKYKSTKSLQKSNLIVPELNLGKVDSIPKDLSNVEYIEPNYTYHTLDINSEIQWNNVIVGADRAWRIHTGSKDMIVAVIDTGCVYHEDLVDNFWNDGQGNYGYDFVENSPNNPRNPNPHSEHCSGIIGAMHNNMGVAGVNDKVTIMCVRFLDSNGSGSLEDALKAIKFSIDNGAKILSNSWGGGGFSQSLYDIIKEARDKGILFVAAAGNDGDGGQGHYPSGYDLENIISVAATDSNDQLAYFSNYGEHVSIAAPGVDILSTVLDNEYEEYSGTSMACPAVSGAAALLWTYEPSLGWQEVKDRLLATADVLPQLEGKVNGARRVNVYNALMNTIPPQLEQPNPDGWIRHEFTFSTPHPYANKYTKEITFNIPEGSKYIRVHFNRLETEVRYDKTCLKAGQVEKCFDGVKENEYSGFLRLSGEDTLYIRFTSDYSITLWGVDIDFLEIQ